MGVGALERIVHGELAKIGRPPIAVAVELIGGHDGLCDEEAALVVGAVERRRAEFSAGRRCARRALAEVGCPSQPILMGRRREPIWPRRFAGSITHDGRYAAALAYPSPCNRVWLSIDLIDRPRLEKYTEVLAMILHPGETPSTSGLDSARLFSAKEVAIKILSPHVGAFVDFKTLLTVPTERGFLITATGIAISISVTALEVEGIIFSIGAIVD
jgi:enterobactin synthetase component D